MIQDAITDGDIDFCRETAFPKGDSLDTVLAKEEADPDTRSIRKVAAEGLQKMAASGRQEAARSISQNYDTFLELCGMTELGIRASGKIEEQLELDKALLPKARVELLSPAQAMELEEQLLQVGDRAVRIQAAVELGRLAELGDETAGKVIVENAQAYLLAMQHEGTFTGLLPSLSPHYSHPLNTCAAALMNGCSEARLRKGLVRKSLLSVAAVAIVGMTAAVCCPAGAPSHWQAKLSPMERPCGAVSPRRSKDAGRRMSNTTKESLYCY